MPFCFGVTCWVRSHVRSARYICHMKTEFGYQHYFDFCPIKILCDLTHNIILCAKNWLLLCHLPSIDHTGFVLTISFSNEMKWNKVWEVCFTLTSAFIFFRMFLQDKLIQQLGNTRVRFPKIAWTMQQKAHVGGVSPVIFPTFVISLKSTDQIKVVTHKWLAAGVVTWKYSELDFFGGYFPDYFLERNLSRLFASHNPVGIVCIWL